MLWLLPTVALASGVMRPQIRFIDNRCNTRDPAAPWTGPIYVTGFLRGSTSAPGGPVHHREYALEADGLHVTRDGCDGKEPGHFEVVGTCGEHPMFRYRGTLAPGVRYKVWSPSAWQQIVTMAGTAKRAGCSGDPLALGAVGEKTFGETTEQVLTVPGAALRLDRPGRSAHLPIAPVAEAVGMDPLYGPTGHMIPDDFTPPETVELHLSVRPYRHRYELEDDHGRVWCETRDAAIVEVEWRAQGWTSSVGWEAPEPASRKKGYCPT